jgi:predicted AAA+ superfamily ATPase
MLDSLILIYHRLIDATSLDFYRYLYTSFNTNDRLTGLVGARGVGKTTLLLQYIKNNFPDGQQAFYVSADHIYFDQVTLYAFVEELHLTRGITYFFIDEIHKYKNWDQEIKNLYDGFPSIHIIFSGSSTLDLTAGSYDLSRRAKMYHLFGMSFREYINLNTRSNILPFTFKELIEDPTRYDASMALIPTLKTHFQAYLQRGFYPFYQENPLSYYEKLLQIIDKTIYEDIANFYQLKTGNLHHLRKLLKFLVTIPPGNMSVHNLAKNLSIDDKTVMTYLHALQQTGLINLIYPDAIGNQLLRRPDKVLLNNTNLQFALVGKLDADIDIGNMRELYFVQAIKSSGQEIFYSDVGDYIVAGKIMEIGGKNKTRRQVKGLDAILVKDNIATAQLNTIPLHYFGMLY